MRWIASFLWLSVRKGCDQENGGVFTNPTLAAGFYRRRWLRRARWCGYGAHVRPDYVELRRRFLPFRETADSDEAAWVSYYRPEYKGWGSLDWEGVITPESRCVVVLGEAGSGKSWEFSVRAEILNNTSTTAFFLPIEDLVDRDIRQCLNSEDGARLEDWLGRSERAVFFLDALDDARLRDPHALRKALGALNRGLGEAFERACVVLSCRVSDWQPKSDPELLRPYFGSLDDGEAAFSLLRPAKPAPFRVLELAPLDRNQVGILAKARGIEPVDQFLSEVDEAEAWYLQGVPETLRISSGIGKSTGNSVP
jgi:hypothetical protein